MAHKYLSRQNKRIAKRLYLLFADKRITLESYIAALRLIEYRFVSKSGMCEDDIKRIHEEIKDTYLVLENGKHLTIINKK